MPSPSNLGIAPAEIGRYNRYDTAHVLINLLVTLRSTSMFWVLCLTTPAIFLLILLCLYRRRLSVRLLCKLQTIVEQKSRILLSHRLAGRIQAKCVGLNNAKESRRHS